MKIDQRGKVIDFVRVHNQIPRDSNNDPCFTWLGPNDENTLEDGTRGDAVLDVFSPEEVVLMVNRFLFQMEYQREFHRRMERERTAQLAPLKKKVKDMFHLRSWTAATSEQLKAAQEALRREEREE